MSNLTQETNDEEYVEDVVEALGDITDVKFGSKENKLKNALKHFDYFLKHHFVAKNSNNDISNYISLHINISKKKNTLILLQIILQKKQSIGAFQRRIYTLL